MQSAWSGCFLGYRGEAMQDLGYGLPRKSIPRTSVNKGKKRKGRSYDARPFVIPRAGLGLSLRPGSHSVSVSHSLGRPTRFKTRRHKLGGLGLDER
jgi:hypothetical protein